MENIKHPISVARKVMEDTPHVLLVGEGARQFAIEKGFKVETDELSEDARKSYENWLKKSEYKPIKILNWSKRKHLTKERGHRLHSF